MSNEKSHEAPKAPRTSRKWRIATDDGNGHFSITDPLSFEDLNECSKACDARASLKVGTTYLPIKLGPSSIAEEQTSVKVSRR